MYGATGMERGPIEERRLHPAAAVVFYGAMAVVAMVWGEVRGEPGVFRRGAPEPPLQALYGASFGVPIVLLSMFASARLLWARRLNAEFRRLLGPLSSTDVLLLAGGSALGEEMLFRGAMQPTLGLGLTSVIFGLAHLPPRRELWPWSATAAVVGLGLGGLYEVTGSILAPVIAHFTINWFNLHALAEVEPGPEPDADADPDAKREEHEEREDGEVSEE